MSRKIRTLLFSTLYPNSVTPGHGVFVETRLRHLLRSGQVETRVVAPVPWFPFRSDVFGRYARMARVPLHETLHGIDVSHPRYLLPPKVGQSIAPMVLARGALPTIRRIIESGFDFDLIDAHFYYPDGVAAGMIARKLGKPLVITARGSDITLYSGYARPRRLIEQVARQASASIGVCQDLVQRVVELGADPAHALTIRNGVDLELFRPLEPRECRGRIGIANGSPTGKLFLCVGHLVERKGQAFAIRSLLAFPDATLILVGDGPDRAALEALARELQVADRVIFAGVRPQTELSTYFSAADVMILASRAEGWANVLLESMACGTPVVATTVNGTPEVVASPEAGRLAAERTSESINAAIADLLASYPDRKATRAYAETFSWSEPTDLQVELFRRVLNNMNGAP